MNKRMDRSGLNIGAYILQPYARTEEHIRDLSLCGVDFVVCMGNDRPALDLFEKYGVGAIVSGVVPGWWGGDGDNAGTLAEKNPIEKYLAAAEGFEDHPAVWGIDIGDEPSALDFPHYGKVFASVDKAFPNQFPYLNLYPNYASVAKNDAEQTVNQLGTATYAEHIEEYCKNVPADYICYDFYLYSINVEKAYDNLCVVADACRRTGRDMWIVLQVNSSDPNVWMSENMLRFQAYTAMAFGAQNIIWACYTAGWWHNQVLDGNGEKTQQYEKLKKVNAEISELGKTYMKFDRVSTHFVGFGEDHPHMSEVSQSPVEKLSTGTFIDLCEKDGAPLVVGQMKSRHSDGARALMICTADDPADVAPTKRRVTFRCDSASVSVWGGEGRICLERGCDGAYAFDLPSNGGAIVVAR
ncbi:MAG: hypothetical protein IJY86_03085 [Clostridia bacterium]|nr:hypothetical protein [Clostridia bacterium]